MGVDVNWRAAAIAIDRGFDHSFDQGIRQIGNQIYNVITRTQEIVNPLGAYFRTSLETRLSRNTGELEIFWPRYEQSITRSLLRNAALLRKNGAPKEEVEKAKAEWKMWKDYLEPKILNLPGGQGIQFLALRGLRAENGVSMQQVSTKDGQLVLESQLLPFNQVNRIDAFQQQLNNRGEDISLLANGDIDPVVTWAVQGPMLDFQQDLPGMIEQVSPPLVFPNTLPAMTPMVSPDQFRQLPEVVPITATPEIQFVGPAPALIEQAVESERPIPDTNVSSFWFKLVAAAAVPNIVEMPMVSKETILETMTSKDLLVQNVMVESPSVTITIFEAPDVKPTVINLEPEEKFKPLATTKQHLNVTAVNDRCCFPEIVPLVDIPVSGASSFGLVESIVRETTGTLPKSFPGNPSKKIEEVVVYQVPKRRREVAVGKSINDNRVTVLKNYQETAPQIRSKIEIPTYQHNWELVQEEDIPNYQIVYLSSDGDSLPVVVLLTNLRVGIEMAIQDIEHFFNFAQVAMAMLYLMLNKSTPRFFIGEAISLENQGRG